MTAQEWRERGFNVTFRNGTVYLYKPSKGFGLGRAVMHAPIAGGMWMEHDDLAREPWAAACPPTEGLPAKLRADLRRTAAACYCAILPGTTCDFCSGMRAAPEAA